MEYAIGVDFGGSSAKIGLVTRDGLVLARETAAIQSGASFETVLALVTQRLKALVAERPAGDRLVVTGIDMPGFIDKKDGIVVGGSENIPCFKNRSPQDYLARALGVPAFSENDGTAAAAGELLFGAGKQYSNFVLITLGTAIGGGLVLGGKVYRGSRGFAGEVGHICVVSNGALCSCGSKGCFEQYASGTAISRFYSERMRKRDCEVPEATPKIIAERARRGERLARETIEEAGRYIAQALGSILNLLDLEACVVGGGVADAGDILLEPVRHWLADYCWAQISQGVHVLPATLGNDAGIQGAAAQALERIEG